MNANPKTFTTAATNTPALSLPAAHPPAFPPPPLQHLSPYEQQAIMPWVRTWPQRLVKKFTSTAGDWVPPFVAMFGIVWWSEKKHAEIAHSHRD